VKTQPPAGSYRSALAVREFDGILLAFLASVLGDSAAYLAVTVLVYERTHSPLLASLTFAVAFAPYLLGGLLLSGLVDRLQPKRLLISFDIAAGALVCVMVIPGVPIAVLFAVLITIGALSPVRSGTSSALVAEILPDDAFMAGRSALRVCAQSSQILGAGIGGGLVALLGARVALAGDAGSFAISALIIAVTVKRRPARSVAKTSVVADSLRGIRLVWHEPPVRRLLLLGWLVPFVAVAPEGLAAPAVAQLGASPGFVGLWLGAIPVGMVVGDLMTIWLVPTRWRRRLMLPLAGLNVTLLTAFALRPNLGMALALLVGVGLASAYGLGLDQRIRDEAPPDLLARTFTVNQAGTMVTQGVGFAAAGALGEVVSANVAIAIAGALGIAAVAALSARLRTPRGARLARPLPVDG
jgi:MFS family permease